MVVSCSVCGEQYGVTEDVTFHKFPANEERRKKWLDAVQRGTWLPGKRSMLCSKHFSRDKFVYKLSGDKVRRYLMPDTVPTIFDRTSRKSKIGPSQQCKTSNEASSSNANSSADVATAELKLVPQGAVLSFDNTALNSTGNLNLEILATTSVGLEPYLIAAEPEWNQVEKETLNAVPKPVETPAAMPIAVAGSSSNCIEETAQNRGKRLWNYPTITKKIYKSVQIQTDLTSLPKRSRQVYPGDFKQLNYNDVTEVSKSWTVLNNYVKKMRNNMKVLRQRNRRLEKRVTDLKSVVKFLKNRIVVRDSEAVRLCGRSSLPDSTAVLNEEDRLRQAAHPLLDHDYISKNNKSAS